MRTYCYCYCILKIGWIFSGALSSEEDAITSYSLRHGIYPTTAIFTRPRDPKRYVLPLVGVWLVDSHCARTAGNPFVHASLLNVTLFRFSISSPRSRLVIWFPYSGISNLLKSILFNLPAFPFSTSIYDVL
jgi:hypothetical protein